MPDPAQSHYDLMLERPGEERLLTFALDAPPPGKPGDESALGYRRKDHRRIYLDYEGDVSGGRGSVRIWDRGRVQWLALDPSLVRFRLSGARLQGIFSVAPARPITAIVPDSSVTITREPAP